MYQSAIFLVENDIHIEPQHFELKPKRLGNRKIINVMQSMPFTDSELYHINEGRDGTWSCINQQPHNSRWT